MRTINRDINIISMSALDLFCSALGAFILLAAMSLPFFPNTTTDEGLRALIEELTSENEQLKEELSEAISQLEKGLQNRENDIVIVIDTTGSMEGPIDALKNEIVDLTTILSKLSEKTRISVIEYDDYCMLQPVRVLPLTLADESGAYKIKAFAEGLSPRDTRCGNRESPEALDIAVEQATSLDFRAEAAYRFMIVIGDFPPLADRINATLNNAAAFGNQGSSITSLFVRATNPPVAAEQQRLGAESFYRNLAERGNGQFMRYDERSFSISLLLALAEESK